MRRNTQAVFFDAGYTLLCMDPDQPTLFRRVCAELEIDLDHARFSDGIAHANALLAPRHPSRVPRPFSQAAADAFWTEYNRVLLSVCAHNAGDAEKAELVYRRFEAAIRWRIYDDVVDVLVALRRRGLRLGVISNWTGDLEDVLKTIGLHEHFDFVLDSARIGHEKPHRPIFDHALDRAGVPPTSAVHIGDSLEHDVEGALASGIDAILLDRAERHAGYERAPRIATLADLVALV